MTGSIDFKDLPERYRPPVKGLVVLSGICLLVVALIVIVQVILKTDRTSILPIITVSVFIMITIHWQHIVQVTVVKRFAATNGWLAEGRQRVPASSLPFEISSRKIMRLWRVSGENDGCQFELYALLWYINNGGMPSAVYRTVLAVDGGGANLSEPDPDLEVSNNGQQLVVQMKSNANTGPEFQRLFRAAGLL